MTKQDKSHIAWLARQIYIEGIYRIPCYPAENWKQETELLANQTSFILAKIWFEAEKKFLGEDNE